MSDGTDRLNQGRRRNDYETLLCDEDPPPSRGFCSQRTGLEKTLFLVVTLTLFGSVIIAASLYSVGYNRAITENENNGQVEEVCTSNACAMAAGNILGKLDESADPCDDMVRFSCGKWLDETEIPGDKSRWGNFDTLQDLIKTTLRNAMESNDSDSRSVDFMQKMYKGCMDEDAINQKGYGWFFDNLVNNNNGGWPFVIGSNNFEEEDFDPSLVAGMLTRKFGNSILIGGDVGQDSRNSTRNIIYVDQPSIVLSRQMYITNDTKQYQKYFDAYKSLSVNIAKLLIRENKGNETELNESYVNEAWDKLLQLETKIAKMSSPPEERRNETRMYNKFTLKTVDEQYPNIGFRTFFEQMFLDTDVSRFNGKNHSGDDQIVIVREPDYFEKLNEALVNDTDFTKENLANYMFLRATNSWIGHGPKEMEDLAFEFDKATSGTSFRSPRWQKCVSVASSNNKGFGMAAGHVYIKKKFDEESRKIAGEMVDDIKAAFKELVSESEWMGKDVQDLAQDKANGMLEMIGFPDWLPDGKELDKYYEKAEEPKLDSHLQNVVKMAEGRVQWWLNKLDQETKRDEWSGKPAIVNAWYSPDKNTITFPAGILQGSFFNKDNPKYLNYGSIGVVIGHEITHGFDDQGRQFDKNGNANSWWDDETIEKFKAKAQCFVDMYGNYTVPELIPPLDAKDAHLNGIITQGENVADNGGVREGYRAYKNFLKRSMEEKEEPKLPGLQKYTNDQLFFISFAQTWCEKMSKESLLNQVLTNPHSPAKYRIIGPLSNSEDFVNAFSCSKDSRMNRKSKCLLW